jgi:hypothetical protein
LVAPVEWFVLGFGWGHIIFLHMVRCIHPPRWLTPSGGYGANMLAGRLGLPRDSTRLRRR